MNSYHVPPISTGIGQTYELYDAEGRICAVSATPIPGNTVMTGYLYDADGNRVAKGTITAMSCDPATSGLQTARETDYVLGPGGQQLTELGPDGNGNSGAWVRTHVYAAGNAPFATYNTSGLYFRLTDWLGSLREITDYAGVTQQTCNGLPFGDSQTCSDQTEDSNYFTGKERDAESGNDYFGARYYASSMGRFMSPDPSQLYFADPTNPQSLNLYSYAYNNPLINIDPSGMDACAYDNGNGTSAIVNAGDGGAVDCPGNGFYITTTQQVTAVGYDANGDLGIYGANGSLYNPDGSAYNATQTITVSPDGSSYVGVQAFSSGFQFITYTSTAPNNGYKSNYPSYKGLFCTGDALAAKGVSLGLDVVGAIPGLGNAVSGTAAVARTVDGIATWGGATAGLATMDSGDPIGQGSALAGAGLAWYNVALGGTKAIPIVGNVLSFGTGVYDAVGAYKAYQSCMASPKYD